MSTRFVVCVDIDEDDLSKAYAKLHNAMDLASKEESWEGWESTDEAYNEDSSGWDGKVNEEDLQKARMSFFDKADPDVENRIKNA